MKLKDFIKSDFFYGIHCDTLEKTLKLSVALNFLGAKWCSGRSYIEENSYDRYKEKTVYTNRGTYADVRFFNLNLPSKYLLEKEEIEDIEKYCVSVDEYVQKNNLDWALQLA